MGELRTETEGAAVGMQVSVAAEAETRTQEALVQGLHDLVMWDTRLGDTLHASHLDALLRC